MVGNRQKEEEADYVLDGLNFGDFEGFCAEFSRVVLAPQNTTWNGNLDAFNDFLSWPAGENRWILTWRNSHLSQIALGHGAMILKLEQMLETCHPSNRASIAARIEDAKRGKGPTLFDTLVGIICENAEYVELRLE